MNLSPTAQATLLLTSYFSHAGHDDATPLTNAEWGRFALWLKEKAITPADLLVPDAELLLSRWHDLPISAERIVPLLNRGHSLALAVEKWQRAGLWVVTRSDPEYPRRLKQRLKTDSPPVLFGCGNKDLLNKGGLAVVGSRHASDADLSFAGQLGAKAAWEDVAIVSGGAGGVDETAMIGAMQEGGSVIGVMADSLLKATTSAKWRKGLMAGHVVLISPFYPEAGPSAGNAMARNKYIYCLADSSLVIDAGKTGGTLSGAEENLKKGWVPLWVKPTTDKDVANADLVRKGARWYEADIQSVKVADLFAVEDTLANVVQEEPTDLFAMPDQAGLFAVSESGTDEAYVSAAPVASIDEQSEVVTLLDLPAVVEKCTVQPVDFYQLFIVELQRLAVQPITVDGLADKTGLHKSQLNDWLKRAVDEGLVKKFDRPVCYQVKAQD